jgi:hypothetical protein
MYIMLNLIHKFVIVSYVKYGPPMAVGNMIRHVNKSSLANGSFRERLERVRMRADLPEKLAGPLATDRQQILRSTTVSKSDAQTVSMDLPRPHSSIGRTLCTLSNVTVRVLGEAKQRGEMRATARHSAPAR